jgi:hypothetical protein
MNEKVNCPVCREAGCSKAPSTKSDPFGSARRYDCPRCGQFVVSDALKKSDLVRLSALQQGVLSHRLRRQQHAGSASPSILRSDLPQVDDPLPTPAEQADNLIPWLGRHQRSPAQDKEIPETEVSAWIGAAITPNGQNEEPIWLLQQPQVEELVERTSSYADPARLQLTMAGWQRCEALKRAQVESHTAFMAMQFGDAEFNWVVNDCFKPAVKAAGFELRLLTDRQPAGLIDDQLRVALRTSRFVIADLTHDNNGAYWEAGFAEGLGRPVIYTCGKQKWDTTKSHFDTSHLNTIVWDPENLQDAATRLTAMIRNTLPAEAKMTD